MFQVENVFVIGLRSMKFSEVKPARMKQSCSHSVVCNWDNGYGNMAMQATYMPP